MKPKSKKHTPTWIEWLEAFSIAVIIVLVIRTFLFDLFVVPSSSMEKSIQTGDFILVNKFEYGIRLPQTPLALPFVHQKIDFLDEAKSYSKIIQLPYLRWGSIDKVKRGDVVLFNYPKEYEHPVDQRSYYLKRCVGLPGDELQITKKMVFVNDTLMSEEPTYQYNYHVKTNGTKLADSIFQSFEITEGNLLSNQGDWQLTMPMRSAEKLKNLDFVHHVIRIKEKPRKFQDHIFPFSPNYTWNKDNFGPLQIPAEADTIYLNNMNLPLYENIICDYEGHKLETEGDSIIFIDGRMVDYYIPDMNYYFVMGDNRDNSMDSRYWGFVPENHIVGKAQYVLFSVDKSSKSIFNRFRFNRILKKI